MQLIGVYINDGDKKILKNLSIGEWYPFGNFRNCHDIFFEKNLKNNDELERQLKLNQEFNKSLYLLNEEKKSSFPININCIVGKNGSGKSSLLSIVYRIINNFSCEIKSHLNTHNIDYHPVWAIGFNAELYYELSDESISNTPKIYCLKIDNNYDSKVGVQINIKEDFIPAKVKVSLFTKDTVLYDSTKTLDEFKTDEKYLELIRSHFFYTVGTNYSLYSNSVVTDEWDYKEEKWLGNIYHKNDGYFTPVVLVPYKSEGATIDTKKELSLAKERISTLAVLIYAQNGDFIENLTLDRISYELIKSEEFIQSINEKTERTIQDYYYYTKNNSKVPLPKNKRELLIQNIKEIWNDELFKQNYKLEENVFKTIKENTLAYLSYKTLKTCLYYDEYKNEFSKKYKNDILKQYKNSPDTCINIIKYIISELIKDDSVTFQNNFTNLKIKQCITFLDNLDFYLEKKNLEALLSKNEKSAEKLKKQILKRIIKQSEYINVDSGNENLTYDFVFENLLPPYFKKQFYFKKTEKKSNSHIETNEKTSDITISSLSSGESQLLNSMSYSVYHIKNAITSKIKYKNINLIFDEAELYYHPEYQRTYIKDLLGIISRSQLKKISGINITLVTHSPFILSDIPSQNLLCLKDGKNYNAGITNSLGANFYDLLQNQFFMDSSIGAVTEKIINKIIDDFNIIQYEKISENRKIRNKYQESSGSMSRFYDSFIENLSDEYLKSSLKNMIDIIRNVSFRERRIKELEDKIKKLEGKNNA